MNLRIDSVEALARFRKKSLIVGLVMSVASAICASTTPHLFFPAYLVAFLFYWSLALGCLALSCLHHITGGGWGITIRRTLETAASTIPLLALLFVPLLFGLPRLYEWARPEAVAADIHLKHKALYLNTDFFKIRAVFYFVTWYLVARIINAKSLRCDLQPDLKRRESLAFISAVGLVLWALTVTFASIDWAMSLDARWVSGIYGVIFMAGQAVSSISFAISAVIVLNAYRPVSRVLTQSRMHDLGNFLMAFVLFWTYTSFTQYLVIWSGNLPEEAGWYLVRGRGGWQAFILVIVVFHFLVPFLLLLSRSIKRTPNILLVVSLMLLAMRGLDIYWQVMPTFSPSVFHFNWAILVTIPAIGGTWLSECARKFPEFASVPVNDPQREEARDHAHA